MSILEKIPLNINLSGHLMIFDQPKVMGILNVTHDSFYDGGKYYEDRFLRQRIEQIVEEGADIIDIGGCSTRPGSISVSQEEEWKSIERALKYIRKDYPEIYLSIDTFRAEIARRSVIDYGADIINDISGGSLDCKMWETVSLLDVPYVLMHSRGNPETMSNFAKYSDITAEVITELSKKVNKLHNIGIKDVIIDPGFGFAKTLEQNWKLFSELEEVGKMGLPMLVGISHKSMITKLLGAREEESLTGTIAAEALALYKGAQILRVHDVKATKDLVRLITSIKKINKKFE